MRIKYKIKIATEEEIYLHLKECSNNFNPPLANKVNIREYSNKLFQKSITFEAWSKNTLIGLVATYFNDIKKHTGYITNVSILKDYMGMGIASELIKQCIKYAKINKFKIIKLEVNEDNNSVIRLYKRFGFVSQKKIKNSLFLEMKI